MDTHHQRFTSVFVYGIGVAFLIMLAILTVQATLGTTLLDQYMQTHLEGDNPLANVLVVVAFALVARVVWHLPPVRALAGRLSKSPTLTTVVRVALCLLVAAENVVWVLSTRLVPNSDPGWVVYIANGLDHGEVLTLDAGGYLTAYPHQLGLIWMVVPFVRLFGERAALAFQLFNALCVGLIAHELSLLSRRFGLGPLAQLAVVACVGLFFPLMLYALWVYGIVCGLAFALLSLRLGLAFLDTGKPGWLAGSAAAMLVSMLLKGNYQVFAIALGIVAAVEALRCHNVRKLALPVLLALAMWAQGSVPRMMTQRLVDEPLPEGFHTLSWIAMGLSDESYRGAGWFESFPGDSFDAVGHDREAHGRASLARIQEELGDFASGRRDVWEFLARKTASQWNAPDGGGCCYLQFCTLDTEDPGWLGRIASNPDEAAALNRWLGVPQLVTLVGALLACVLLRRRALDDPTLMLLPLTFVGGFVLHLLWEAQCSYTMPYFVLLLPLAVAGWCRAANKVVAGQEAAHEV